MYITPKRLRHMGLGLNLADKTDAELAEQIRSASQAVDAFCNVPRTPQPYTFKGGTIAGETHGWGLFNRNHRVWPFHQPVRAVTSLRINATESLYIDFPDASDYYVNPTDGYVEIINFALTKVGLWGQANVPQMGLVDPVVYIDYTYGYRYSVVDEDIYPLPADTTVSGDEDYTDFMAPDGFWAADEPVTVKVDGVEIDESDFVLDRNGGFVKFDSALDPDDTVSISYIYRVPRDIARATALSTVSFMGEASLVAANMTGIESLKAEELEIRRIGSRSGAEKGVSLPAAAQSLLGGWVFWTARGG